MLIYPKTCHVLKTLAETAVKMLESGDIVIKNEIVYYENHLNAQQEKAQQLYDLFTDWAKLQDPPVEDTNRNFFRVFFSTLARLKAKKQVVVKVAKTSCELWVFANTQEKT